MVSIFPYWDNLLVSGANNFLLMSITRCQRFSAFLGSAVVGASARVAGGGPGFEPRSSAILFIVQMTCPEHIADSNEQSKYINSRIFYFCLSKGPILNLNLNY